MQPALPKDRLSGALLVAAAIITVAALSHHPFVAARQPTDAVKAIIAIGPVNAAFHVFVIVMVGLLYMGLVGFAQRRGLQSPLVLGGLIAASWGLAAETGAGLIDGFFISGFSLHLARNPSAIGEGLQIISAAALALQILAKAGLFALSVAILLWSIDLFDRDRAHVVLAIVGCVAGALALVAASTVAATMNAHNVTLIFGVQALWYMIAGVLMIRGRL